MPARLAEAVRAAIGSAPRRAVPLHGGCVAEVYRLQLEDGREAVAKWSAEGGLAIEGWMLGELARLSRLPVPAVWFSDECLLLLEPLPAEGSITPAVERHAADLLAGLHGVGGDRFGYARDTVIGGLPQPNPWNDSWRDFFRDHRLLYMAGEAQKAGRLPARTMVRVERLAGRLGEWIDEPAPSLIHGDMWGGNVLVDGDRISGFVDPAIYFADAEIELAFSTLFGTFGDAFFTRYAEHRPLRPGFWEGRRDLYNLYPLLVHVRLFGGGYVGSVERTLAKLGSRDHSRE